MVLFLYPTRVHGRANQVPALVAGDLASVEADTSAEGLVRSERAVLEERPLDLGGSVERLRGGGEGNQVAVAQEDDVDSLAGFKFRADELVVGHLDLPPGLIPVRSRERRGPFEVLEHDRERGA